MERRRCGVKKGKQRKLTLRSSGRALTLLEADLRLRAKKLVVRGVEGGNLNGVGGPRGSRGSAWGCGGLNQDAWRATVCCAEPPSNPHNSVLLTERLAGPSVMRVCACGESVQGCPFTIYLLICGKISIHRFVDSAARQGDYWVPCVPGTVCTFAMLKTGPETAIVCRVIDTALGTWTFGVRRFLRLRAEGQSLIVARPGRTKTDSPQSLTYLALCLEHIPLALEVFLKAPAQVA
jgi:hypothetical protein